MANNLFWPGWETIRLIGRGSFGAVYEIQRDVLGDVEKAALKVISIPQNDGDIDELYNDGYNDESITSTFQNHLKSIVAEYSLMRKMNGCSNIVNCDDIRYVQHDDAIGWDIFIKMELLTPLTKSLSADISEETVLKSAKDICTALDLCKKHEIVHRDIKPQNIFVSTNGDYKLGDFGIAKTVEKTMGGTKIGTYKYMAPEVYNNQPYGTGADIYSLGLVLYWLLNERRMPFLPLPPAKLSVGMEEAARNRRFSGEQLPAPVHGSDELKRIVLKACAYNPEERYLSAREMLDAVLSLYYGFSSNSAQYVTSNLESHTTTNYSHRVNKVTDTNVSTDLHAGSGIVSFATDLTTSQNAFEPAPIDSDIHIDLWSAIDNGWLKNDILRIPDGVTRIGAWSFLGEKTRCVREIIIPSSVKHLEAYALAGMVVTEQIIIPNSVEEIGHDAFFLGKMAKAVCAEGSFAYEYMSCSLSEAEKRKLIVTPHSSLEQMEAAMCEQSYKMGRNYMVKNAKRSAELFMRAAKYGYAPALYDLGLSYELGEGVRKNAKLAAAYYELAAKKGYTKSLDALAKCYYTGFGAPKSLLLSAMWQKSAYRADSKASAILASRAVKLEKLYSEIGIEKEQIDELVRSLYEYVR